MSYDIAVFDPRADLRDRAKFKDWYDARTEWDDEFDYQNPMNATPALQAWYREMIQTFPPMNGPDAAQSDDAERWEWTADYTIASDIIYVAFSWSKSGVAYETMRRLASMCGVGFFDASGDTGAAWFPASEGMLEIVHEDGGDA